MKKIAYIFSHSPHGTSLGREGLDLLLSISITNSNISIFFIGDGILQLMQNQNPEKIFSKNYVSAFKILPLFGIKNFYFCKESLIERGLYLNDNILLNYSILSLSKIRHKLDNSDLIINF